MDSYRAALLAGRRVGVWGVGHIGFSTLCHFAQQGVAALGYDVDPVRVGLVNRGEYPIPGVEAWLGLEPGPLVQRGLVRATTSWHELASEDVLVHFVCVPTEQGGRPSLRALLDVRGKLACLLRERRQPAPLVILESTVPPGTLDRHVVPFFESAGITTGRDVLLGCAPRRDWFGTPERSLHSLPRVVGGTDEATTQAMLDVLGIVCQKLVPAPDHRHAEAVKSFENAFRQTEITLANQLALAYPDLDVRTVLELAATKWNVGTFCPSFGIGGYCIPLAGQYVLEGATHPEHLSLLEATICGAENQARQVADYVARRRDIRTVGILGLSYAANTKIWAGSPTLQLASVLRERGLDVRVNDGRFSAAEIRRIAGAESFPFPQGLEGLDAVLLVAGHREYAPNDSGRLRTHLTRCRLVLDNVGLWSGLALGELGIEYHVAGDRHWLTRRSERLGALDRRESSRATRRLERG